jgi:hypothetical protein
MKRGIERKRERGKRKEKIKIKRVMNDSFRSCGYNTMAFTTKQPRLSLRPPPTSRPSLGCNNTAKVFPVGAQTGDRKVI